MATEPRHPLVVIKDSLSEFVAKTSELAKAELKPSAKAAGIGAGFFAGAAVFALHAIWIDLRDGGSGRLYYSRSTNAGLTWTTPRDVTGANARKVGGFSFSLDLQNRLHLAWHYGDPSTDAAPTEV